MVSAYLSYPDVNRVRVVANRFINCNGLPDSIYYRTRAATECRIKRGSTYSNTLYDAKTFFDKDTKYFGPDDYQAYQIDCSVANNDKDFCGSIVAFNRYGNKIDVCQYITSNIKKTEGTDTTHGRSAVAKDTCINKLMDGYNSYKCTDAQEKYWRGNRKCGQYPDMIQDVTLLPDTNLDSPCGEEMKWDKSSCLQKKTIRGEDGNITANFKCTMDYTLAKTGCTEADKSMPLCKLDEHFFYDLDILQQYNDDKEPKHKTVRETYEPCSKDKTIYGDLKKKFDDYYKVPTYCITDNKGGNVDVLAASFVTRVAVLRWGLAFYYIEICFLLLTVMHAYYCTSNGGAETNLEMGRTSEKPPPPPPGQL